MVHHKETNIVVERHEWKVSCAVVIDDSGVFVGKVAKTKKHLRSIHCQRW